MSKKFNRDIIDLIHDTYLDATIYRFRCERAKEMNREMPERPKYSLSELFKEHTEEFAFAMAERKKIYGKTANEIMAGDEAVKRLLAGEDYKQVLLDMHKECCN